MGWAHAIVNDRPRKDVTDKFREIAERDLGAVHIVLDGDPLLDEALLSRRLPDGRHVVVEATASEVLEKSTRLDLLLECFLGTLEAAAPRTLPAGRPPITRALHRELEACAARTEAADVFIVDIDSPVVWCSARTGPATDGTGQPLTAEARAVAIKMRKPKLRVVREGPVELIAVPAEPSPNDSAPELPETTRLAVDILRGLPGLEVMRLGKGFRHVIREGHPCLMTRSLAQIYLLTLVFEGPFDEIRAERDLAHVLPRVESLILGLPPLDPDPRRSAKVKALRRG